MSFTGQGVSGGFIHFHPGVRLPAPILNRIGEKSMTDMANTLLPTFLIGIGIGGWIFTIVIYMMWRNKNVSSPKRTGSSRFS